MIINWSMTALFIYIITIILSTSTMFDFVDWNFIDINASIVSLITSSTGLYQMYKAWKFEQNEVAVDKSVADDMPLNRLQKKMIIGGVYNRFQNKIIDGKIQYDISDLSNLKYITDFESTKIKTHSADIFKTECPVSQTGYVLRANIRPLNIRHMARHYPKTVELMCKQGRILNDKKAGKSVAVSLAFVGVSIVASHIHSVNESSNKN